MGSQQQSFFSTPAFELFRRGMTTQTIQRFRGMNSYLSAPQVAPDVALDCLNVIVSGSGNLEKFRLPVNLSQRIAGYATGPDTFFDFQYYPAAGPVRQVVANFGNALYYFTNGFANSNIIENDPSDAGPWSAVEVNNILFMANGQKMMKWTGTKWQNWGIAAPTVAPGLVYGGGGVNSSQTQITASPGGADRLANVLTVITGNPNPLASGDKVTFVGVGDASMNVTSSPVTVVSTTKFTVPQIGSDSNSGGGYFIFGTCGEIFQHKWAYAYVNDATGDCSSMSPSVTDTDLFGNTQGGVFQVTATAPTDTQVTSIRWYRTYDGGGIFYRILNPATATGDWPISAGGLSIRDAVMDIDLDKLNTGSFLYNPPPVAKFLVKFQGRIFGANLVGAPQDAFWTGYEQILNSRPEECVPANNRIHLALGAEGIGGLGVTQPGVVFFSTTGGMWILRGAVEDFTQQAPVQFTELLEECPWQIGCISFTSIQSTQFGVIWWAGDKTVQIYDGTAAPQDISQAVLPLLRSATPGLEYKARSGYFNWLERDWYVLLFAQGGSITLNKGIAFSLNVQAQQVDAFPFDIQADAIGAITTASGQRQLIIAQGGLLAHLAVESVTTSGVSLAPTATAGELAAYWRSGYFGNDAPYRSRTFRKGTLIADNQGFGAVLRVIDDRRSTFRNPEIINIPVLTDEIIEANIKAHRLSVEIVFPKKDIDCSVLEMSMGRIDLADR